MAVEKGMGLWQGVPAGWRTWRVVLTLKGGTQVAQYVLAGHVENAIDGACDLSGVERKDVEKVEVAS